MSKHQLFAFVLTVIVIASVFIYAQKPRGTGEYRAGDWSEADRAVNLAKSVFLSRRALGETFDSGQCLSDALMPGWVADIVHKPRQAVDDLPENQCSSFRQGRSIHFVELDPQGIIVRVK